MNEKDVRLLFDAGHWENAQVARVPNGSGWQVYIFPKNSAHPVQTLASKRGGPRIFKTSDTAIQWCKDVGFSQVFISLGDSLMNIDSRASEASLPHLTDTVLLVEDNSNDVAIALHAFKKHGLKNKVVVTSDGEEALNYLFARDQYAKRDINNIPRLILLDLKLPKISGLEVLRQIRENEITQFIPVVLLTTSDEHSDVIEGYKLGSNSYIKKPEDYNVFEELVASLTNYWLDINTPPPNHRYQ